MCIFNLMARAERIDVLEDTVAALTAVVRVRGRAWRPDDDCPRDEITSYKNTKTL